MSAKRMQSYSVSYFNILVNRQHSVAVRYHSRSSLIMRVQTREKDLSSNIPLLKQEERKILASHGVNLSIFQNY